MNLTDKLIETSLTKYFNDFTGFPIKVQGSRREIDTTKTYGICSYKSEKQLNRLTSGSIIIYLNINPNEDYVSDIVDSVVEYMTVTHKFNIPIKVSETKERFLTLYNYTVTPLLTVDNSLHNKNIGFTFKI